MPEPAQGPGFHVQHDTLTTAATRDLPRQVSALDRIARALTGRMVPTAAFGAVEGSARAGAGHARAVYDGTAHLTTASERLQEVIGGIQLSTMAYRDFDTEHATKIDDEVAHPVPPADVGPRKLTPAEILRNYQVDPDPGGTTKYPQWPLDQVVTPKTVTATEAKMLDSLNWYEAWRFSGIRDEAYEQAQSRFSSWGQEDGHGDAYRHAYASALLERQFGASWTADYTTAHEALAGNPPAKEAMDLFNNEVGRNIAVDNPDLDQTGLATRIEQAVRNGETVVIDGAGDLQYSDQVLDGQTYFDRRRLR